MKKNIIFFLISIYLTSCETIENYDIAIQNVTIFQSQEKITLKHKTILIKNDTIAAIVDANQKISAKQIIQGNERLVTSGFIDTHVHLRQMLDLANKNPPSLIDDTYRKKIIRKSIIIWNNHNSGYGATRRLDTSNY